MKAGTPIDVFLKPSTTNQLAPMKAKQRTIPLSPVLAALLATSAAAWAESSSSASAAGISVSTDSKGKVVVVTEVNGKKETRVLDLGANAGSPLVIQAESMQDELTSSTWLGVATETLSKELSTQVPVPAHTGLIIQQVIPNSPASKAGLQVHDVLARLNDQILITPRQLSVLVGNMKDGDTVKLTYIRKGQPTEATATLGQRPPGETRVQALPSTLKIGNESIDIRDLGSVIKAFITDGGEVALALRDLSQQGEINLAEALHKLPEGPRRALEAQYDKALADPTIPEKVKELLRKLATGDEKVDLKILAGMFAGGPGGEEKLLEAVRTLIQQSGVSPAQAFEQLPENIRGAIAGQYLRLLADPDISEESKSALREIAEGREPTDLKPLISIVKTFMTKEGKIGDAIQYLGKDGGVDFAKTFRSLPPETRQALEAQYDKLLADPSVPEKAKAVLRSIAEAIENP